MHYYESFYIGKEEERICMYVKGDHIEIFYIESAGIA